MSLRIVGLLQVHNNVANGYLRRCLRSLSAITDQIVVYDDGGVGVPEAPKV